MGEAIVVHPRALIYHLDCAALMVEVVLQQLGAGSSDG
jgi:hypothetical protein